jgi:hypothetical protein
MQERSQGIGASGLPAAVFFYSVQACFFHGSLFCVWIVYQEREHRPDWANNGIAWNTIFHIPAILPANSSAW